MSAPDQSEVIRHRIIICLASAFDYDPTSKHHIMRTLARNNHVLWVNYHGTRRPGLNTGDIRGACRTLASVFRGTRRINETMVQTTPMVLPAARRRLTRFVHQRLLIAQIRRALRAIPCYGRCPIQVWAFAPDVAFLKGAFSEEVFVYDCVDEFSRFTGCNRALIESRERDMLTCADVVITTSSALAETKRQHRPDVHLVRHGVEYDHFAQAWRDPPAPPVDLSGLDGPVFGFFGLIHDWVDLKMVIEAARLRPDYAFVMIGECRQVVEPGRVPANVHLLGRRSYASLPAYCARFNAALLPFVRNTLTQCVNPIKLREYLAAGLPVLATPLPEVVRYAPHVATVRTAYELAEACDQHCTPISPARREAISRSVADESWDGVVATLSHIVLSHARKRG